LKKRRQKRERIHISISTHHSIARDLNVKTSKSKAGKGNGEGTRIVGIEVISRA
jgi:hypothetical protein